MQERWTTVSGDGGVRLAVRVLDGPAPVAPRLLLHHGLASSQRIWDLMLPHLIRRFRVVTFDARGHGRSAKPTAGYGFAHVTRDARAVIRTTGLRRPWVVGHSLVLAQRRDGSPDDATREAARRAAGRRAVAGSRSPGWRGSTTCRCSILARSRAGSNVTSRAT